MMQFIIEETGETKELVVMRTDHIKGSGSMYDFTMYQSLHTNHFGGCIRVERNEGKPTLYMKESDYNLWRDALAVIQKAYDVEAQLVAENDSNYHSVRVEVAKACMAVKHLCKTDISKAMAFADIQRSIHLRLLKGSVTNREATNKPASPSNVRDSELFEVKDFNTRDYARPMRGLRAPEGLNKGRIKIVIDMPLAIFTDNQEKIEFVQEVTVQFDVSVRGAIRYYATFIGKNELVLSGKQEVGIKKAAERLAKKELKNRGVKRVYDMPS